MVAPRILALGLVLAFAFTPASAEPAGKTFAEIATSAKQAYDTARAEMAARGAKAKAAALAGDFAKWGPLNEAYAKQMAVIIALCETHVLALSRDATDYADVTGKQIVQAFTPYAEVAGNLATIRLQMLGFAHLLSHVPAADRAPTLKALAAKYFTGE